MAEIARKRKLDLEHIFLSFSDQNVDMGAFQLGSLSGFNCFWVTLHQSTWKLSPVVDTGRITSWK